MAAVCKIVQGEWSSAEAQQLIEELDQYLAQQYWDYEPGFYGVRAEELAAHRSGFWLAYTTGQAVGCIAIRPFTDTIAELKRLYVQPPFRNRGIGRQLLATAESAAIAWGYTHLCLETGDAQTASLHLYTQAGFQAVPCFGKYADPASRCYEKSLI